MDSAGTGSWHAGSPAHEGTRAILPVNWIALEHRARQITADDLDAFDYVIVMDAMNLRDVRTFDAAARRAYFSRLLDYAPGTAQRDVPDPYHTGGFEGVYALVNQSCDYRL